jgi:tetratricopeptide (TPR) repeat protein
MAFPQLSWQEWFFCGGSSLTRLAMGQAYDDLGFPIPAEFEVPGTADGRRRRQRLRQGRPSRTKRWVVLLIAAGVLLPAIVGPELVPLAKQAVVRWSLERAFACEARDDVAGAVAELGRAVAWHGDDPSLLAARAMLRLENGDPVGAQQDADRAVMLSPGRSEAYRVRSIVHVCTGRPEAALADVARVVDLAGDGNAEAINLRAYVRGLVGREIDQGLDEIERLMMGMPEPPPEYLDTRGFLRHLAGRQEGALADLDAAIEQTHLQRRQMMRLRGHMDGIQLLQGMRSLDHALAVMCHHRGLVLAALGQSEQAQADFDAARQKGFAPERGIL